MCFRAVQRIAVTFPRLVRVVFPGLIMLGVTTSAVAQPTPRVELSGGYALLSRSSNQTIPTGVYASGSWRVTRWLSAVGEVGWHDERETLGVAAFSLQSEVTITTYLGGARVFPWSGGRVVPFAEVLVGARRSQNRTSQLFADPDSPFAPVSELNATSWAIQPGGGVVWWVHRRVGVQAALHYRRTLGFSIGGVDLPEPDEWRLATGITVGF